MPPIAPVIAAATTTLSTASPSVTTGLYSTPGGAGTGMTSHVLSTGGILLFAATVVSIAGYYYHVKHRGKTSGSTLGNMFIPRMRSWRRSGSTNSPKDAEDGTACMVRSDVMASANGIGDGGRLGHVAVDMEAGTCTASGEGTSTRSAEATATVGAAEVDDKGVGVPIAKTVLDPIHEEDEEVDGCAVIDEVCDEESRGALTATFALSECLAELAECKLSATATGTVSSVGYGGDKDDDTKSEACSEYSTESASAQVHSSLLGTPVITLTEPDTGSVPLYDVVANSCEFNIDAIGATTRDGPFLANPDLVDDWFASQTLTTPTSPSPLAALEPSKPSKLCMDEMAELVLSLDRLEALTSCFDDSDEDEDEAADAKTEPVPDYFAEYGTPEVDSSLSGVPIITLSEADTNHAASCDGPAKSCKFSIDVIGSTTRDGPFLANLDDIDESSQADVTPSFAPSVLPFNVAQQYLPCTPSEQPEPPFYVPLSAPSRPLPIPPCAISLPVSSPRARRYGLADMSQFAEALSDMKEEEMEFPLLGELGAISSVTTRRGYSAPLDVSKYHETLGGRACRSLCAPKLDVITEDEDDDQDEDMTSPTLSETSDIPIPSGLTTSISEQLDELASPPSSIGLESDTESLARYSSSADGADDLDTLLNSLSKSEVEFPAAVKPEMEMMLKILQAFRDEQFEWSPPRGFSSDSSDSEDGDHNGITDRIKGGFAAAPVTPPRLVRSNFHRSDTSSASESDDDLVIMPLTPPSCPLVRATPPLVINKRSGSQKPYGLDGAEQQTGPVAVRPLLISKKPFLHGHRHTRSVFEPLMLD